MKVYDYIIQEENNYKVNKIPITNSVEWNMSDYIQRCTNVANGWYNSGKNDGLRPYKDIVTPIINVALRSEGFDVKDIVPYVNSADHYYKSFLVKKYHPQWARKNQLDTFIDEVVYSSVVYDLVLVKNVNEVRPEVVPLQQIAFCDQTDVMSGPICLKHQYSIPDLLTFKGKWITERIDEAITMARPSKEVTMSNDQIAKTPGKYIEVYELHATLPESELKDDGDPNKYVPQVHIVTYYVDSKENKVGITLFKGPENKSIFDTLVISPIFGRACGRSIVETLFEPQVWTNYSEIKIKEMLDAAALLLLQTDSETYGNQKLTQLKNNTILKHETGKPITQVSNQAPNIASVANNQQNWVTDARILGSASEAQLGTNPTSGTPFALQSLVVQQGQGIHEYRRGKIATFFSDRLYPNWILPSLIKDMNAGKDFSEELTLEEMQSISEAVSTNLTNETIKEKMLSGEIVTQAEVDTVKQFYKDNFSKDGNRKFFSILKGELDEIPIDVYVNVAGKQKYMAQNADKLTNIIREIVRNPQVFNQIPGIAKAYNELIENSGMSPIDFTTVTAPALPAPNPQSEGQLTVA